MRHKVCIHQPNYAPWIGYFRKIAKADTFVFLDDVQFSKGSYTNRVRVLATGRPIWLSVPVSFGFGDPIDRVRVSDAQFAAAHLRRLEGVYRQAPAFSEVWGEIASIYDDLGRYDLLADVNIRLIEALSIRLGVRTEFRRSSQMPADGLARDDRLVALVKDVAPSGVYLSGKGGASYQDPRKFEAAGLQLRYLDYTPQEYPQAGTAEFVAGLSVLDAIFNLGFDGAARLVLQ